MLPRLEDKPDGINTFAWIIQTAQAHRREAIAERAARTQIEFIRRNRVYEKLRAQEAAEEARYTRRTPSFG